MWQEKRPLVKVGNDDVRWWEEINSGTCTALELCSHLSEVQSWLIRGFKNVWFAPSFVRWTLFSELNGDNEIPNKMK